MHATDGVNKRLLRLIRLVDVDGDSDEIWHFGQGRAYEVGQLYFGCVNGSTWHGVPLMGLPEAGK